MGLLALSMNVFALTQKVGVNGMVCAFCAQGIEKSIKLLPETNDVYVNLEEHFVVVDTKTTEGIADTKLKTIIVESGYDVTGIEVIRESIADLRVKYEKK
ncbi:MAG: heavy-metal-associated domain-containing protein [Methylophilales bacterium]|nr:heavy-metal-associated domain-containing protein [Methylophilales bacterium]